MIRTAFVTLIALAGLLALGAFYLGRGSGEQAAPMAAEPAVVEALATVTPPQDSLYYLRDIDLASGDIAVVFFDQTTADATGVLRDPAILGAAKSTASLPQARTDDPSSSGFRVLTAAAPQSETYAQIYRDDLLIASIECLGAACLDFDQGTDADLRAAALPLSRVDDSFDIHADYLATIEAISRDPFYMFLHARPRDAFPAPRRTPTLRIALPTVTTAAAAPLDVAVHDAALRAVLSGVLPNGATLAGIEIAPLGAGFVGDTDSLSPILAGGAPIPYPAVLHYGVTVDLTGVSDLSADTLDALTVQTFRQYDDTADFAVFTRDRLQSSCSDCFTVLIEGGTRSSARILESESELYRLSYFDLREAP